MLPIIEVHHVYKKYHFGLKQPYYSLRDSITGMFRRTIRKDEFWALKDISFDVMPGEVVGIIGRNGAGKSTLLKILSRITAPTRGEIVLRGRSASLLEIGTGFSPELTGRENIYLNGAILGMKRSEINDKFDEIVEFSEISKFLDTPVKYYSSGMYMRLAFAIAAYLEPEILLVDEVLAVGDIEFQKKCLGKMEEASKKQGRTVLFVSHNMAAIQSLCSRAIFIDNAIIRSDSSSQRAVIDFLKMIKNKANHSLLDRTDRKGKGKIKIYDIELSGDNNSKLLVRGKDIYVRIKVHNEYNKDIYARLALTVGMSYDTGILSCDSQLIGKIYKISASANSLLICKLFSPPLNTGNFFINVAIFNQGEAEDWITQAVNFSIETGKYNDHVNSNNFPVLSKFEWNVQRL